MKKGGVAIEYGKSDIFIFGIIWVGVSKTLYCWFFFFINIKITEIIFMVLGIILALRRSNCTDFIKENFLRPQVELVG